MMMDHSDCQGVFYGGSRLVSDFLGKVVCAQLGWVRFLVSWLFLIPVIETPGLEPEDWVADEPPLSSE